MIKKSIIYISVVLLSIFIQSCEKDVLDEQVITAIDVTPLLWKPVSTTEATSSKWNKYGNNVISDAGKFVKIDIKNNTQGGREAQGAYLHLDKIADFLKQEADNKNYKITFTAYVLNGNKKSAVLIRNESNPLTDKQYLTAEPKEYIFKRANTFDTKMFIRFTDLPKGAILYISKDIKIEQMADREYIQPFDKPFKGGTLDMSLATTQQDDINIAFQDLSEAGAKYIRIQANPNKTMNGFNKTQYLDDIISRFNSDYLPLIQQYSMKVIFAMENIPYDTQALKDKLSAGYWQAPETKQNFIDTAAHISNAFKNTGDIFALQFMSEPVGDGDVMPEEWIEISQAVIDTVRVNDSQKYIVWSGGVWGLAKYELVVPFDDDKIIYNFHEFKPNLYTHQGVSGNPLDVVYQGNGGIAYDFSNIDSFRQRNNNIPIMCGSYTLANWISDADLWFNDVENELTSRGVSSIYFATNQYQAWDWRYIGTKDGDNSLVYKYDLTSNNKLWTILSEYWKR